MPYTDYLIDLMVAFVILMPLIMLYIFFKGKNKNPRGKKSLVA